MLIDLTIFRLMAASCNFSSDQEVHGKPANCGGCERQFNQGSAFFGTKDPGPATTIVGLQGVKTTGVKSVDDVSNMIHRTMVQASDLRSPHALCGR